MDPARAAYGSSPSSVVVFQDALGERRRLEATVPVADPVEVLCLRGELTEIPSFEFALRERASRLATFRHTYYGRVRSIDRLNEPADTLAVVSDHTRGVRLSTLLSETGPRPITIDINVALHFIRQLVSAAAFLHESARDVAHGAIGPERIIVTPNARVVIVEYVLGAALEQLRFSHERYWRDLRIALPPSAGLPRFDHRADVTQVGTVALSLILGRMLHEDESAGRLADVVGSAWAISAKGGLEPLPPGLRSWLSRALQLDMRHSFASAFEARAELDKVLAGEHKEERTKGTAKAAPQEATGTSERTERADHRAEPAEPVGDAVPDANAGHGFSRAGTESGESAKGAAEAATYEPAGASERAEGARGTGDTVPNATVAHGWRRAGSHSGESAKGTAKAAPFEATASRESTARADLRVVEDVRREQPVIKDPDPVRVKAGDPIIRPIEPIASLAGPTEDPYAGDEAFEAQTSTPLWQQRRVLSIVAVLAVVGVGLFGARHYIFSPAKPAAPATGTLSIDSSPTGAVVMVDGESRGVTPLSIDLKAGTHNVELRGGGDPRALPVTITAGAQVSQYVELPTMPTVVVGQIQIRTEPAGAQVSVDGVARGRSPLLVENVGPGEHLVTLDSSFGTVKHTVTVAAATTASLVVPLGPAEGTPVSGWVSVSAPVDVQIFENKKLLGSSQSDRIMVSAGRHDIEIVNETLGYRFVKTVTVPAGRVMPIKLDWPKGMIAVNAVPWAEVWIDGDRIGDTPIGNLALPIGPHEIVFRHPELGELHHAATVTVNTAARVSVDMRKKP